MWLFRKACFSLNNNFKINFAIPTTVYRGTDNNGHPRDWKSGRYVQVGYNMGSLVGSY